jgi:hypothetical protein
MGVQPEFNKAGIPPIFRVSKTVEIISIKIHGAVTSPDGGIAIVPPSKSKLDGIEPQLDMTFRRWARSQPLA